MKAVLISIQPKWVELIASGKKTVEVRKTRPKIETPFKCYIYCTNGEILYDISGEDYLHADRKYMLANGKSNNVIGSSLPFGNRKVMGEFVCDKISEYQFPYSHSVSIEDMNATCLTANEFCKYGSGKTLYGWHISDLKIYDKPKELGEFRKPCLEYRYCEECKYSINEDTVFDKRSIGCDRRLTLPPQSWVYIEI